MRKGKNKPSLFSGVVHVRNQNTGKLMGIDVGKGDGNYLHVWWEDGVPKAVVGKLKEEK